MQRLMGMKLVDGVPIKVQQERAQALKTWYDGEIERARGLYPRAFSTTVDAGPEHRGEEGAATA